MTCTELDPPLWEAFRSAIDKSGGALSRENAITYRIDNCDFSSLPSIFIQIGEFSHRIRPSVYGHDTGQGVCYVRVVEKGDPETDIGGRDRTVIGIHLIKAIVTEFDQKNGRIGFCNYRS